MSESYRSVHTHTHHRHSRPFPADPKSTLALALPVWRDRVPYSSVFKDTYYSPENPLAESYYVYIQGNSMIERWQGSAQAYTFHQQGQRFTRFTIVEFGFGTGLNFCASIQAFSCFAPPGMQLHYIACEKYPLARKEIQKALSAFPAIKEFLYMLLKIYPVFGKQGLDREGRYTASIALPKGKRALFSFYAMDVLDMCQALAAEGIAMDACFLDGFAPARNPEMWRSELFDAIASVARDGATCSSYSAASILKKGLRQAGFQVRRLDGFGKKRHMLQAKFQLKNAHH